MVCLSWEGVQHHTVFVLPSRRSERAYASSRERWDGAVYADACVGECRVDDGGVSDWFLGEGVSGDEEIVQCGVC